MPVQEREADRVAHRRFAGAGVPAPPREQHGFFVHIRWEHLTIPREPRGEARLHALPGVVPRHHDVADRASVPVVYARGRMVSEPGDLHHAELVQLGGDRLDQAALAGAGLADDDDDAGLGERDDLAGGVPKHFAFTIPPHQRDLPQREEAQGRSGWRIPAALQGRMRRHRRGRDAIPAQRAFGHGAVTYRRGERKFAGSRGRRAALTPLPGHGFSAKALAFHRVVQGASHVGRAVEALAWDGVQQGRYDVGERSGHALHRGRRLISRFEELQPAFPGVGTRAGQRLVEHQAYGIQVGPRTEVVGPTVQLLGRHVRGRARDVSTITHQLGERVGDAQIGHPDVRLPVDTRVQQHVLGLEILVQQLPRVDRRERVEDLVDQR